MYKIKVERVDDDFHFVGTNERGNQVHMDTGVKEGGHGEGAGPMQLLVMAIGGCSGIDIISILKKGRQQVDDFNVDLTAERFEGEVPSLFKKVHAHYTLKGDLDHEKVKRAIELSIGKYCSVSKTIEATAEITFSYTVNDVDYV
ncbi:MAG: OsmC family protein [Bacteroidota bacterium]